MRRLLAAGALFLLGQTAWAQDLGVFEGQSDVGAVAPPGAATHDVRTGEYVLTSAGANIWARVDGFHYLWKKMSGDAVLTAEVSFPPIAYKHDPSPHRKGVLMFRQTLDPGSAQASVHVHGVGMVALQHRAARGDNTLSTEINIDLPHTVRLEKRGDNFTLFVSQKGEPLHQVGATTVLHLDGPFYVGIGATSHDAATIDKVVFRHVTLAAPPPAASPANPVLTSTLHLLQVDDGARRDVPIWTGQGRVTSPDWMAGSKAVFAYKDGQILRIPLLDPLAGAAPEVVNTGALVDCAGDYGVSPDGKAMAVSCAEAKGGVRNLYVMPLDRGAPRKLTNGVSSFFHGWSADGATLLFTRGKAAGADFFSIPAAGGAQTRLTRDTVNDGPEFTPDGKFIYFDSSRSGSSQIWRMNADGTGAMQITDDGLEDQSPHVSPDGAYVAWLQMTPGAGAGVQDASLQIMSVQDGAIRTLIRFQGNRGSFPMPVWGDKNHLVFVSYQMLPATDNGATQ